MQEYRTPQKVFAFEQYAPQLVLKCSFKQDRQSMSAQKTKTETATTMTMTKLSSRYTVTILFLSYHSSKKLRTVYIIFPFPILQSQQPGEIA